MHDAGVVIGKLVLGWLLGSLSGSLLMGRLRGVDIRTMGSGNAGGTNALRTVGWRFAIAVVAIDVGKGVLAAWLGFADVGDALHAAMDPLAQACACGFMAVLGHCWPVFFGFRGGKGGATAFGAVLMIAPWLALAMAACWLLLILIGRYVGLATVLTALAGPLLVAAPGLLDGQVSKALLLFAVSIAALITFTHRSNLARMRAGTEPRIGRSSAP